MNDAVESEIVVADWGQLCGIVEMDEVREISRQNFVASADRKSNARRQDHSFRQGV